MPPEFPILIDISAQLFRAGPADLDTHIGSVESETVILEVEDDDVVLGATRRRIIADVKELHYIPSPTEHDPHLTVVTIKLGKVANLARTKIFTRTKVENPVTNSQASVGMSDYDYKTKQLDRTIEAAQEYAATRARLKRQAESVTASDLEPVEIYRTVLTDGSVYFGDRPPSE